MSELASLTGLDGTQFAICLAVVFFAGMVRGFSGFALSAMVMASLATQIAPVELIVTCWFLEMSASLLMVRGGIKHWDKNMVAGLVTGSATGAPVGLYLTSILPVETSKKTALAIILVLAAFQLSRVRIAALNSTPGALVSGFIAGIVTGLASVGGMVVALYVLARDAPASMMRASLVMYLALSSLISVMYMTGFGMMNEQVIARGLILAPVCMLGVVSGKALFRPSLERYYKPFCLGLLMLLSAVGLYRLSFT